MRQWLFVFRWGRADREYAGYTCPDDALTEIYEDVAAAFRHEPAPEPRSWEMT